MTSKNSFLASIKENNKRRLWVWVLSLLAFVLVLPIITALEINGIERALDGWIKYYGKETAQQMLRARLFEVMEGRFGFNLFVCILTVAAAIVSAVQGFSYLYSRKKIDFYMGMPVKRKRRFLIIWLNGILIYLLPYLLGNMVSLLIAAGAGAVNRSIIITALVTLGADVCLYLCIYHLAMLAVMLTGNIVITGFGFVVFCLYELGIRTMLNGYRQMFFRYFNYYGMSDEPVLSPFTMYGKIASRYVDPGIIEGKYYAFLLLFALAAGILSYFCYLKRPAETAGSAMVFAVTKPVIKIALVVPASLLSGLVVAQSIGFDPHDSLSGIGYMILSIALVAVIGSALIQVIYEFDIKGAFHKKLHIIVSGIIVTSVFAVFHFDLLGYDSYIPKPEQLESVAFVPLNYEDFGGSFRFDEDGNYLTVERYADRYMYLAKEEEICELVDISMTGYNEMREKSGIDNANYVEAEEEAGRWSNATVIYRLKNGRKVCRSLMVNVDDARTAELLDSIIGSEEFKKGYFIGTSERLDKLLEDDRYKISASYGNRVYDKKIDKGELEEFLEVYRRDFAQADFGSIRANTPVGLMRLEVSKEIRSNYDALGESMRSVSTWYISLGVYPFYTESIAWLKDHDYYLEHQLDIKDVARIQVLNHNFEVSRQLQQDKAADEPMAESAIDTRYSEYGVDTRVYVDYTDEEQMEEIISCIYPTELVDDDWDHGRTWDSDYTIMVYFNTDSELTKEYGTYAYYGFLEGDVPDFVRVDTAYKE